MKEKENLKMETLWKFDKLFLALIFCFLLIPRNFSEAETYATPESIDWRRATIIHLVLAIEEIESSGNSNAIGMSGERGSCQFMQGTWREVMPEHPFSQAFNQELSRKACQSYLLLCRKRLIKANLPVSLETILWAYNAGIGNVKKSIKPETTKIYIEKVKAELCKKK